MMNKMMNKMMSKATTHDSKPWFCKVVIGQKLNPLPLWNQTERWQNRLDVPTEVLGIGEATSQSGVSFKVKTRGGTEQWLDAGWFEQPA